MDNKQIIEALKLTASLLELYGENQFKVRSYQTAVYNLERTESRLNELSEKQLADLSGVGKSIAATINEINQEGASSSLDNLLKQTPTGLLELLKVKGIGARKIKSAWDHLGVESAEELFSAATKGELAEVPGFGKKTQDNVLQILTYHLSNKHLVHYKQANIKGKDFEALLAETFDNLKFSRTGAFRRKVEVLGCLEYIWATSGIRKAEEFLNNNDNIEKDLNRSGPLRWAGKFKDDHLLLDIRFCKETEFGSKLVYYTGNIGHLRLTNDQGNSLMGLIEHPYKDESSIYDVMDWPVIIPELREGLYEKELLEEGFEDILKLADLKGILHNHSTYSDGKDSLKEMAKACQALGYQYFGISDHSQTAVYANGLDEEKVFAQHQEIDRLNQELAPFKIFKGIESDILNDGKLDYPDEVLQKFDFIVASIHFNMNMDIDKATKRLITAIENPYTTILGHPTGRQLLKREGYPIHHEKVIDACAKHKVVIEINAHPWRLDLDWRWVRYAISKGVCISINPDAHQKDGLEDVYYGVNMARKAGLTRDMTFNALDKNEIDNYFKLRKNRITETSSV